MTTKKQQSHNVVLERPKHQNIILGFGVLLVHVLYDTLQARYDNKAGQIWPTGQCLTPLPHNEPPGSASNSSTHTASGLYMFAERE